MTEPAALRAEVASEVLSELGEGPVWDSEAGTLIWVDIEARTVHRLRIGDGQHRSIRTPSPVGAVALRRDGGLVLALADGFWLQGADAPDPIQIAAVEAEDATTRMNDGKVDHRGRFWAGTKAYDSRPGAGSLYRLEPDWRVDRVLIGVSVSNGLDWSADGRLMYYVDTPTQRVDVFDFDPATGVPSGRRTFVEIPNAAGAPDGLTVDAEGGVWVALFGGGVVHRYTTQGELAGVVAVAASQVTSCAFGGPRLDRLFVTTAATGLDAGKRQAEPLAGAVFACRPGVSGLEPRRFAG